MRRPLLLFSLLLLAVTTAGCAHGKSEAPGRALDDAGPSDGLTESELARLLPGVESADLAPAQRSALAEFASDVLCPCAPVSLDSCVREQVECPPVPRMIGLAKRMILAGQPAFSVATRVESYVNSFAASRRRDVAPVGAVLGRADAPVTIVEFSDFQCPACRAAHPVLVRLVEAYPDDVRVVFRHFPLPQHAHAEYAARAAVYAEQQGRFAEFAALAFENPDALDEEGLRAIARAIELDEDALWSAVTDSPLIAERVALDKAAGLAIPIQGTPSLFINGRPFHLPVTLEYLSWSVEDELAWIAGEGTWTAR